jgi:hypothetical protein
VSRRQYGSDHRYRRALQVAPKRADVHYKLAKACEETEQFPKAYRILRRRDLDDTLATRRCRPANCC